METWSILGRLIETNCKLNCSNLTKSKLNYKPQINEGKLSKEKCLIMLTTRRTMLDNYWPSLDGCVVVVTNS